MFYLNFLKNLFQPHIIILFLSIVYLSLGFKSYDHFSLYFFISIIQDFIFTSSLQNHEAI